MYFFFAQWVIETPSDNAYQNYYHLHEHYHEINSGIASAERLSRGSENFNI
jgi:hypothetical protein